MNLGKDFHMYINFSGKVISLSGALIKTSRSLADVLELALLTEAEVSHRSYLQDFHLAYLRKCMFLCIMSNFPML